MKFLTIKSRNILDPDLSVFRLWWYIFKATFKSSLVLYVVFGLASIIYIWSLFGYNGLEHSAEFYIEELPQILAINLIFLSFIYMPFSILLYRSDKDSVIYWVLGFIAYPVVLVWGLLSLKFEFFNPAFIPIIYLLFVAVLMGLAGLFVWNFLYGHRYNVLSKYKEDQDLTERE